MFYTDWQCSSAADCVNLSRFWGHLPMPPLGLLDAAEGTLVPQNPCAQLHIPAPNPGYATVVRHN